MDFPHFGETELVSDRGEDFDYREGSFTFGSEFWIGDGTFKISGFQSDFVTFGKGGESSVVV